MLRFIFVLAILGSTMTAWAFDMSGPENAKTTQEIVAAAKKDCQGALGERVISTAEFNNRTLKVFVAWYSPYSGEAACHLYLYTFDDKQSIWERKVAKIYKGTQDLSVECGDKITIRDVHGKAIDQYPRK